MQVFYELLYFFGVPYISSAATFPELLQAVVSVLFAVWLFYAVIKCAFNSAYLLNRMH